ncbi:MAG: 50S ribosomal protein L15 [candidate division Zixibacteria bacterium]|nr:50S ribosomal protein L15 [candidate division Zixibacteria bacterium]
MDLHTLKPAPGSTQTRRRVGRGSGSGLGKTSGRGHKGQKARSGWSYKYGKEGGQMPIHRRLPKFGFTNIYKTEYQVVNVAELARCTSSEVTIETLRAEGIIKNSRIPVKILGNGSVEKAFTVKAAAFSKSAITKIEAAGGKTEVVAC